MELFKKQGGLYVKCGQHLTSMYYLLPEEYCSTMRELTNRAAFVSYKAIAPVFKEEIGMSPKELYVLHVYLKPFTDNEGLVLMSLMRHL